MTLQDGTPKGLDLVLRERGMDTLGMPKMIWEREWSSLKILEMKSVA